MRNKFTKDSTSDILASCLLLLILLPVLFLLVGAINFALAMFSAWMFGHIALIAGITTPFTWIQTTWLIFFFQTFIFNSPLASIAKVVSEHLKKND